MTWRLYISLLAVMILAFSCSDESELYVDQSLEPFFVSFQYEASKRGISVDFSSLSVEGYISDISQEGVVGQCSHTVESPNAVKIDPVFWKTATESRKEFVIFHELGHCYLQRSHLDTADEYGNCISMMHSTAEVCSVDYENKRELYLDELFKKQ